MARPESYEVLLRSSPSSVYLCRCCAGVLLCEGKVAGDPNGAAIAAEDIFAMKPDWVPMDCATCASLRAFEEKRSRLAAPPRRIGAGRTVQEILDDGLQRVLDDQRARRDLSGRGDL